MAGIFESDVCVSTKGFSNEQSKLVAKAIFGIMHYLVDDYDFDFRRLHRIIVTHDYAGELAALSAENPSRNAITHTNEEYAKGVAQVVTLRKSDDFEFVVVLAAGFGDYLIGETTEEGQDLDAIYRFALHSVHHEFCHVHDLNNKMDALRSDILSTPYRGKDTVLGPLTELCWSEYFATRTSSPTADTESIGLVMANFTGAVERTKRDFDKEILAYRQHSDLGRLMENFQRHGGFLAKSAAYALGYVDGLGQPLEELSADGAAALTGSYFEPTWNAMHDVLIEMRRLYPKDWKSLEIFRPLSLVLEDYYGDIGLELSNSGEDGRYHVNIPFRPETTPNIFGFLRNM